jgi:hypothetical protein
VTRHGLRPKGEAVADSKPVRPCKPGEDPVDWMHATGQMSQSVYDIVKGNPRSGSVAAAAKPAEAAKPQWTRKVFASAPPGVDESWYAVNPGVDDAAARGLFSAAVKASGGAVPTLFSSGDLPAFTASGISPNLLAQVPWPSRHAVAAAPTVQEAEEIMAAATGPDGWVAAAMEHVHHRANQDYQQRVQDWVMRGIAAEGVENRMAEAQRHSVAASSAPADVDSLTDDQLYEAAFGAGDAHRKAEAERDRQWRESRGRRL